MLATLVLVSLVSAKGADAFLSPDRIAIRPGEIFAVNITLSPFYGFPDFTVNLPFDSSMVQVVDVKGHGFESFHTNFLEEPGRVNNNGDLTLGGSFPEEADSASIEIKMKATGDAGTNNAFRFNLDRGAYADMLPFQVMITNFVFASLNAPEQAGGRIVYVAAEIRNAGDKWERNNVWVGIQDPVNDDYEYEETTLDLSPLEPAIIYFPIYFSEGAIKRGEAIIEGGGFKRTVKRVSEGARDALPLPALVSNLNVKHLRRDDIVSPEEDIEIVVEVNATEDVKVIFSPFLVRVRREGTNDSVKWLDRSFEIDPTRWDVPQRSSSQIFHYRPEFGWRDGSYIVDVPGTDLSERFNVATSEAVTETIEKFPVWGWLSIFTLVILLALTTAAWLKATKKF